jgi:molybdopterin converting factor subunit 1
MSAKHITVRYYAQLREQRGQTEEVITTQAGTAAELYDELADRHGFVLQRQHLRVAIRDAFTDWSAPLHSGDTVQFIPPVAGG